MKKVVLTFGLIAGAFLSAMMLLTMPFHDAIGFERSAVIGYSTMVLAFLLVFFGMRSYRDNVGGGRIGFWRALGVGALIVAVASACYVATWQVISSRMAPDYLASYQAHTVEKMRADGATEQAIARKQVEMAEFAELYRNPAIKAAVTFLEPLPVGLVMVLVSAGVLSRRPRSRRPENGVIVGTHASS